MTKLEIIMELEKYGIEATLRPRKKVLQELLARVRQEHADGMLTSDVVMFDDLRSFEKKEMEVTTEEWMEFTKVDKDRSNQIWVGLFVFLLGALVVYLWEDGVSFAEMGGLLWIFATLFGIPAYVYAITRS